MTSIKQVLDSKGHGLITGQPDWTVFEAIKTMAENNVGALLVEQEGQISGIFTERDYLRKIALKFRSSRETPLSEVMTSPVITATMEDSVDQVMETMTEQRCRHMPIVDGAKLVGIVSIGDLVKQTLVEKEHEIEQLSHYIQGSY